MIDSWADEGRGHHRFIRLQPGLCLKFQFFVGVNRFLSFAP